LDVASAETPSRATAVYAVQDPALGTLDAVTCGPGAWLLRVRRDGRVVNPTPLRADGALSSFTLVTAEGEMVIAIACDPSWSKDLGPTVEQIRKIDCAGLDLEQLAGSLCARLCQTMSPAAAAVASITAGIPDGWAVGKALNQPEDVVSE